MRLRRTHVDRQLAVFAPSFRSRLGLENVIQHHRLSVFANDRHRDLTAGREGGHATLAVDPKHRFLPTQVGTLFGDLAGNHRVVPALTTVGRMLGLLVGATGGDPVESLQRLVALGALVFLRVVDLDVTTVALRCPTGMAGVAFHAIEVLRDALHRHHTLLAALRPLGRASSAASSGYLFPPPCGP